MTLLDIMKRLNIIRQGIMIRLVIMILYIYISFYSHNVRRIRVYKHNRMSNENYLIIY